MKRCSTTWSLLLALCLLLSCVPAGAFAEEEPTQLHFITRGVAMSTSEDTLVKTLLEEKFNLKINWEVLPSTDYAQASQVIIASGDYPDMMEFAVSTSQELQDFIDDGILTPLNGLLEEYGQNILAARPNPQNWYWDENGERWTISCRFTNVPEMFYTIRQDWLDALGLEMPANLDELVEAATQFTFGDPDGNGIDDTYGFGGPVNGVYQDLMAIVFGAFGVHFDWKMEGERYIPWQLTQNAKEAIRYFRENIYKAGIVEPDFMVMTRQEYLDNKNLNRYGIEHWFLTHTSATSAWWNAFMQNVPQNVTVSLPVMPHEGYDAVFPRPVSVGSSLGFSLFIFSQTEHPEKIVQLIDYLATDEGADLVGLGIKGLDWDEVNGQYVGYPSTPEEQRVRGKGIYEVVFWHNIYKRNSTELCLQGLADVVDYTRTGLYMPYVYDGDTSALGSLINSSIVAMIMDESVDVDMAFEAMKADYMAKGGAQYVEWYNEQRALLDN